MTVKPQKWDPSSHIPRLFQNEFVLKKNKIFFSYGKSAFKVFSFPFHFFLLIFFLFLLCIMISFLLLFPKSQLPRDFCSWTLLCPSRKTSCACVTNKVWLKPWHPCRKCLWLHLCIAQWARSATQWTLREEGNNVFGLHFCVSQPFWQVNPKVTEEVRWSS